MIRTQIVGVEGEHADHLATTTAPKVTKLVYPELFFFRASRATCRVGFVAVDAVVVADVVDVAAAVVARQSELLVSPLGRACPLDSLTE